MKKNNFKNFVAGSIFTLVLSSTVVYVAGATKTALPAGLYKVTITSDFGSYTAKLSGLMVN